MRVFKNDFGREVPGGQFEAERNMEDYEECGGHQPGFHGALHSLQCEII